MAILDDISDASEIIMKKVNGWIEAFIDMLPNLAMAFLVLMGFLLLSRLLKSVVGKALKRWSGNIALNKLVLSLMSFAVVSIGLFVALSVLNLDKTVTSLLAGVGVIGLALGFAFQHAAANLISGVIMATKSPINVGDIVESNGNFGVIKKIGLRSTTMYLPTGQNVEIPNRLIFENPFKHYTINGIRRIDLSVGVSYGDDLQKVEDLTKAAISKIEYLLAGREVELFFTEFGDSSINFEIRYWVSYNKQQDYMKAVSDGIKNIKMAYDNNDITIPFPIRTLDFGIKGGETLSQMEMNIKK